jgi:hypothetical protein
MAYSKAQKEHVFQAWYNAGRPTFYRFESEARRILGGLVTRNTLEVWSKKEGWLLRADDMDAEAAIQAEQDMIANRRRMTETHQQLGVFLQTKGAAYLLENGITTEHAAIRALESGVQIERRAIGMPEIHEILHRMSTEGLLAFIAEHTARLEGTDTDAGFEEGVLRSLDAPS